MEYICVFLVLLFLQACSNSSFHTPHERRELSPCGNGNTQSSQSEQCDDGNIFSLDGCSSSCQIEPPYICDNSGNPSVWYICGDSI